MSQHTGPTPSGLAGSMEPIDPATLPAAVETEVVEIPPDGSYAIRVHGVAKVIGDQTFGMLAYNGCIPGPTLKVRQGSQITVEVTNVDTGAVRTAVTGADGLYSVPLLQPGNYNVRASLQGFRAALREGVRVTVTETSRVVFELEVGQLTETVTVTGTVVQVLPLFPAFSVSATSSASVEQFRPQPGEVP